MPWFSPAHHFRFERISLEQGLSQSIVYCILQDNQGFMWFGTDYENQEGRETPLTWLFGRTLFCDAFERHQQMKG